jgi:hypothetical protein
MLISVESKLATYHHVVVVWREMVIDYESMYTYPLTKDTLRQICGVNTTFQRRKHLQNAAYPEIVFSVNGPHQLNSVVSTEFSLAVSPIFRNDAMALVRSPGHHPVAHGF